MFKRYVIILLMLTAPLKLYSVGQQSRSGGQNEEYTVSLDALCVTRYLGLFLESDKQYLKQNSAEPKIKCKQCVSKVVSMSEFGGGLIGRAIKDIVDRKVTFDDVKPQLDNYLKVVANSSYVEIASYMINIYNNINKICPFCGFDGKGDTWEHVKDDKD